MFDHMFSHSNYTVFMISMRIGKQRIPLWFRCFEGKSCPDAFKETLIKEGITYVSNLFTEDFESMYAILCTVTLYLTILGADFAKNTKSYTNVKISTHTNSHGKKIRIMSLFKTGLTLFQIAFNSKKYIRLPFHFTLYDS